MEKNIIPVPYNQRQTDRSNIEIKLDRKLSLRPTPKELEQRNIIPTLSHDQLKQQVTN